MDESTIITRVRATAARRVFGVGTLAALGLMLLWLVVAQPPSGLVWQIFLVVMGAGALWLFERNQVQERRL